MIVAVDGPAASGKGTLAKRIAAHYGLAHLDTGRTYRAVALALREQGAPHDDVEAAVRAARTLDLSGLGALDLSGPDVAEAASRVAVMGDLRRVLVERQRAFANEAPQGAVLDGRDIGTVVCPDATVKLFVTASAEERARRRSRELYGTESGPDYVALLAALRVRDERDRSRKDSPLVPAHDAHLIDTTRMGIEEAVTAALSLVENAANA